MHHIRASILKHVRLRNCSDTWHYVKNGRLLEISTRCMSVAATPKSDDLMARVVGIVKKYDKIDPTKVTEKADFQKDLNLDSLDRVELVMAFEAEFNIEIPDEKADKLSCCADVAEYIFGETNNVIKQS